jgi:RimJ/RimL family protein N-acetyltransferase
VPLSSAHYSDLFAALGGPERADLWTWLPVGPARDLAALWMLMADWLERHPETFAIVPRGGRPEGVVALINVEEQHGKAEIGFVVFGDRLSRTREATEAIHLLQAHVLDDLGYRRLEWKCDSLNAPSRRAAERLGFTFEGRFRNHWVVKERSRDTDWLSITDAEWPAIRSRHAAWLDPANFDPDGTQLTPLAR